MGKIENYLAFVKDQVGVQQKLAKKYEDSPYRKGLHQKTSKDFADLADFLFEIQSKGTRDTAYLNRGDSPQKRIAITYEDIDGAPEELLRELNLTETDKQDLLIEYLIAQAGGILSLDKIMVELFKRSREVPKRNTLTSRLYRMAGKGVIYNVPGRKGTYSTYELSEADAKKIFGESNGEINEEQSSSPAPVETKPNPPAVDRLKSKFLSGASTGSINRRGL